MKSFALALFAGAAYALSGTHSNNFVYKTYHPRPVTSGTHAPVYTQTKGYQTTPQQFGYGYAAPNYSTPYGLHQPNHSHNPFDYSRPVIPYVAAKLAAPVYARCTFELIIPDGDGYVEFTLQFG